MNDYPTNVKEKFENILKTMSDCHYLYSKSPHRDFTRQNSGKLSFFNTVKLIVGMGKGSTNDEIMDYFDMDPDLIPSQSAFNQRRSKILPAAFECLFSEFSQSFSHITNTFKEHCILAVDGCHICYSTNSEIIEDYNKPYLIDHKGHNHMHLNGLVDAISKVCLDIVIQPGQKPDERKAFHTMIDHFDPDHPEKYIVTADRGYESYDMLFHCELKKLKYVFRLKAPSSSKSILSSFIKELPDDQEEFDVTIKRFFTDKYTNIMKDQDMVYHYMNPSKNIPHFYEMLKEGHIQYLTFRVAKIKTGKNTYEYLITNLPADFTLEDLKECYHLRWGIETAFRYIKHAAGLLYFHSKKPEYLKQEIYAALIRYNFGIFLANEAARENQKKKRSKNNKYIYDVDFSSAIKIARKYLIRNSSKAEIDVIKLIMRYVHAVKKEFRQFNRCMRGIGAIRLNYR